MTFISLLVLQTALIALLLVQRSRRRRTEARNSAILRALPDLMFLQTADGVYVDYHAADPSQLLRPPEQFLGKNMRDILPAGPLRQFEAAFAQAIRTAEPAEPVVVEYDLDLPLGNRRFEARLVRSSDNQILTLVRDITEQARAETALREGAQRYALASAAGAVGMWDWNFETNQLYVDAGLKSLLGFEDAEISTNPEDWGGRVHPQDLPIAAAQVKACIDGDSDAYEVEHRMLHKDGSVKWFLSRGSAIRAQDGTIRRLVGTKVDITKLKRAEEALRENEAALRASNEEIQHLAGSLISAQDAERARIARDLHDDVSQQFAALSIALSGLKRRLRAAAGDYDLQSAMSSIQQSAVALGESIRQVSLDLHPDVLRNGGLTAALTAHCAGISDVHSIAIACSAEGEVDTLDSETTIALYRIAQEALHNVVKHARAGRVEVHLIRNGDSVELTVGDDGQGFDAARTRKESKGLGLMSMSERVRLAKGTLSVVTEQDKGTQVRVRLPIAARGTQDAGDAVRRYAAT
jgi:two-component system, NarL family, sensor histidine kinase UhpB